MTREEAKIYVDMYRNHHKFLHVLCIDDNGIGFYNSLNSLRIQNVNVIQLGNNSSIDKRRAKIRRLLYNQDSLDMLIVCHTYKFDGWYDDSIRKIILTNGVTFEGNDCVKELVEYSKINHDTK